MRTKKVWKSRQTFWAFEKSVSTCADGHASDMHALRDVRNPSVMPSVIYVSKTIGESVGGCGTIPLMFLQLSVKYRRVIVRRWLWHNLVNVFQLSVKYRRVIFRQWLWHNSVNFFQLSVKYRRVIVRRCTRRWNRKFFLFFCVTLSQNLELQSYSIHNTITKADH